jgi:hypothetical protein
MVPANPRRDEGATVGDSVQAVIFASDVYSTWESLVAKASKSVKVFSPYIDDLILGLINRAKKRVKAVVLTDVSPASEGTNYLAKLEALVQLIDSGVEVRDCSRLHAKILMVDDAAVVTGSQNFTHYARNSKEVSVAVTSGIAESKFLATLRHWIEQSKPVDADQLQRLIDGLDKESTVLDEARADLLRAFEELGQGDGSERKRWQKLVDDSPIRFASGPVVAELDWVNSQHRRYKSLLAERGADLTRWTEVRPTGVKTIQLKHLHMCPIIDEQSGRMGFARLAKTRITYVRSSVRWTTPFQHKGVAFEITVRFPRVQVEEGNMEIEFRNSGKGPCYRARVNFASDGLLVGPELPPASDFDRNSRHCVEILSDSNQRGRLLNHVLSNQFKYALLKRDEINADQFFRHDIQYTLNLAEIEGVKIIVASQGQK